MTIEAPKTPETKEQILQKIIEVIDGLEETFETSDYLYNGTDEIPIPTRPNFEEAKEKIREILGIPEEKET